MEIITVKNNYTIASTKVKYKTSRDLINQINQLNICEDTDIFMQDTTPDCTDLNTWKRITYWTYK